MKNIKIFLVIFIAFFATITFATWSQPTATPPSGNTLPAINVGNIQQNKTNRIGATGFCMPYNNYTDCTYGVSWGEFLSNIGVTRGTGVAGNYVKWGANHTLVDSGVSSLGGGSLTGSGVNGNITKWGANNTLTDSGIPASNVGLWTVSGRSVVPVSGRVINSGANSIKVQVGTPSVLEDGMIWLAQ